MTSKSAGRVRTCWSVMSAIASLMTMPAPGLPSGIRHHGPPSISTAPKIALRDLVAPVAEGALGELHDVALVHERHALALVRDRVADRAVDQALAAEIADRLDADADLHVDSRAGAPMPSSAPATPARPRVPKRIFLNSFGNSLREEVENLLRLGRAARRTRCRRRCLPCSRGRSPCRPSRDASPATARR